MPSGRQPERGGNGVSGCLNLPQQVVKQRVGGGFGVFAAHGDVEVIDLVGEALADVGRQTVEFGVGFGDLAHGGGDGLQVAIALGDVVKQRAMLGIEVGDGDNGITVAGAVVIVLTIGWIMGEFADGGHFQAAFRDLGLKINADGFAVAWLLSVFMPCGVGGRQSRRDCAG